MDRLIFRKKESSMSITKTSSSAITVLCRGVFDKEDVSPNRPSGLNSDLWRILEYCGNETEAENAKKT